LNYRGLSGAVKPEPSRLPAGAQPSRRPNMKGSAIFR